MFVDSGGFRGPSDDAGLLADGGQEPGLRTAYAMGRGNREFPTLDPDLQELRAAVDVRAIASVSGVD
jgi:hypothetical protein